MPRKTFMTVEEAVASLYELEYNEGDEVDIVISPPDPAVVSDEEGMDEDDLIEDESMLPDAAGVIEVHHNAVESVDVPPQHTVARKKGKSSKPKWTTKKPIFSSSPVNKEKDKLEQLEEKVVHKSPSELFEMYFDEELLKLLIDQSVLYAKQNNRHEFSCTIPEMKSFIGFLMFTGYHKLPQEEMYWSLDPDCNTPIVRQALTRQRFRDIKKNLHLSDNNNLNKDDKLSKVRPYLDLLNKKFQQFGVHKFNLSIDEQMIPYRGRHSARMFIQGKPIRFGYKAWTLASSDGYVYAFDIYTGKSSKAKLSEYTFGLGGDVVVQLLQTVEREFHAVYFDNFFTSFDLLAQLRKLGYYACGTMRENRTGHCPLADKKVVGKEQRGWYESRFEKKNQVCITRWNDNKAVTVGSNFLDVEPISTVSRFSRSERKRVQVSQPYMISQYNKYMGGVDLADNMVANYRIRIRGKKWWWPIFSNYIDVSMVNAWKIWLDVHPSEKMPLLDFRRQVTVNFLNSKRFANTATGRPSSFAIDISRQSSSTYHHFLKNIPCNKRRRCRQCHSQTRFLCGVCDIPLHQHCTELFHKSKQ